MKISFHRLAPCLLAVALLAAAGSSAAQTRLGNTELGFSFDFDDLTQGSDAKIAMNLRAGRFFGPVELGLEFSLRGPFDDLTQSSSYRLFSAYEFNPGATTVVYGRAGIFGFPAFDVDLFETGFGTKQYLHDDTALYLETVYGFALSSGEDNLRTVTGLICTF